MKSVMKSKLAKTIAVFACTWPVAAALAQSPEATGVPSAQQSSQAIDQALAQVGQRQGADQGKFAQGPVQQDPSQKGSAQQTAPGQDIAAIAQQVAAILAQGGPQTFAWPTQQQIALPDPKAYVAQGQFIGPRGPGISVLATNVPAVQGNPAQGTPVQGPTPNPGVVVTGPTTINITDPRYLSSRYAFTGNRPRGAFDDLLGYCEPILQRLRQSWNAANRIGVRDPLGAANLLMTTLRELDNDAGARGYWGYAPLPHALEAIHYAKWVSEVLFQSADQDIPGEVGARNNASLQSTVKFVGISKLVSAVIEAASSLNRYYRPLTDLCFSRGYECFDYNWQLPVDYLNNFRNLAQAFLRVALELGPVAGNDLVELKVSAAVALSSAYLLNQSVYRREFYREILGLVYLHDDIQQMLAGGFYGSPREEIELVRLRLGGILEGMGNVSCVQHSHGHGGTGSVGSGNVTVEQNVIINGTKQRQAPYDDIDPSKNRYYKNP